MQLRVIIFEDDNNMRQLFSELLEGKGYEVISASDPTLCPVYADPKGACPHKFACGDFLLTDNQMPHMTGLEFVQVQEQKGCKGVVHNKAVISGSWSDEELKTAEHLGCKLFTKPFLIDEIFQWLDEQAKKIPPDRQLEDLSAILKKKEIGGTE